MRTQWVFDRLDTETKEGFLDAVDRRDADTLLPVLQEYVIPGSTVCVGFMESIWDSK